MKFSPSLTYRFKKDLNLPIPIYFKESFFNYYLDILSKHLYPDVKYDWKSVMNLIVRYGSVENVLDKYALIKDSIITYITNCEEYKEFNACIIPLVKVEISSKSIFNDTNIGKWFVSIDLKHANFQTLRKNGVLPKMGWDEFVWEVAKKKGCSISDQELVEYIAKSKYTRQVIFGQCNPKRTIAFEKVYINQVREIIDQLLVDFKLVSMNSDELVYEIPDANEESFNCTLAEQIYDRVLEELGLELRINKIKFKGVKLITENGYLVTTGYLKEQRGESEFKCVPEPYMPMFVEWYNATQGSYNYDELNGFDNFSLYSQYIVHDGVICKIDEKMHIEVVDKK